MEMETDVEVAEKKTDKYRPDFVPSVDEIYMRDGENWIVTGASWPTEPESDEVVMVTVRPFDVEKRRAVPRSWSRLFFYSFFSQNFFPKSECA